MYAYQQMYVYIPYTANKLACLYKVYIYAHILTHIHYIHTRFHARHEREKRAKAGEE